MKLCDACNSYRRMRAFEKRGGSTKAMDSLCKGLRELIVTGGRTAEAKLTEALNAFTAETGVHHPATAQLQQLLQKPDGYLLRGRANVLQCPKEELYGVDNECFTGKLLHTSLQADTRPTVVIESRLFCTQAIRAHKHAKVLAGNGDGHSQEDGYQSDADPEGSDL
ncbi:hypothetical protein HK101_003078 [Irineochytrium annulatum]|nr:hypothetical protein HK101_003078 [Irineochytrium annulatum]